ncbi:MAG: SIS domain-containing protein [Planctomycetes bacterium]|nr:SIS domain-containing protein [Planctomycetota bacterium]
MFTKIFLEESVSIINTLDPKTIEKTADVLLGVRERGGRLFVLGVGGSAGSASHAVNDFRKLAGFEAYAPADNVSELTARTNDEGWETVFEAYLRTSRLEARDGLLILSVGGGDAERNVSANLVRAINYAKQTGAAITGIVGRDGGYTAKMADSVVIIPTVNPIHVTPHTEAFHAVICHLLVSHPKLKAGVSKWESVR